MKAGEHGSPASSTSAFASAAVAVFATFTPGFGSFFTVVGKIAATVLAAFAARLGGAFGVILEIAPAVLAAFAAGFSGALGIILEVPATVLATFAADLLVELFVMGRRSGFAAFFPASLTLIWPCLS